MQVTTITIAISARLPTIFLNSRGVSTKSKPGDIPMHPTTQIKIEGMGSVESPTHTQKDCVPHTQRRVISAPWSCLHGSLCRCCEASSWAPGLVSSQYLISIKWIPVSTQCEGEIRCYVWVSRARSDQGSTRAAGGASSLIRNAGVNE
eukprot:973105-Pelagomonas_calceolata.AAC.1